MPKLKISAVSFLNASPLVYGLHHSQIMQEIDLSLDPPAESAKKLICNMVDIALSPVSIIPDLKESYILSDYCIGAVGKVRTVILASEVPLEKIKNIYLDFHSRSSVTLIKILCKHYWNIKVGFFSATDQFEQQCIKKNDAAVVIGDKVFNIENHYTYYYDLAEEWLKFTGLPFVFACWVANKKINEDFISKFNEALKYGVNNIPASIMNNKNNYPKHVDVFEYLTENISFILDEQKKKGMTLFLDYVNKLVL